MRRVKVRGAKRMAELGQKQIQLWLTPQQFAVLDVVSKRQHRTRTDMVRTVVLEFLSSFDAAKLS